MVRSHLKRLATSFVRNRKAVAATEFAILLPFMLLIYIGVVDVTRGVIASRKLNLFSRTISDLVSQQSTQQTLSASTISTFFDAASAIMAPYNLSGLKMTVSEVDVQVKSDGKTCCDALVHWSYTKGGTLRGQPSCSQPLKQVADGQPATPTTFPSSLIKANQDMSFGYANGQVSHLIVSDVSYTYVPIFYQAIAWFSGGMSKTNYMVPRSSANAIQLATPISPPSGQSGVVCISP